MPILVDSNILIDIAWHDPVWEEWSASMLNFHGDRATLHINQLIYAEVSVSFDTLQALDEALPSTIFARESIPYEAAFLAGNVFRDYRRRGGGRLSPMPDFYIGAHAAVSGYDVLTRDPRRFRSYFPNVRLITP